MRLKRVPRYAAKYILLGLDFSGPAFILNGFEHLFRRLQGAAEVLLSFNLTTFERLPFFRGRIVSLPCRLRSVDKNKCPAGLI